MAPAGSRRWLRCLISTCCPCAPCQQLQIPRGDKGTGSYRNTCKRKTPGGITQRRHYQPPEPRISHRLLRPQIHPDPSAGSASTPPPPHCKAEAGDKVQTFCAGMSLASCNSPLPGSLATVSGQATVFTPSPAPGREDPAALTSVHRKMRSGERGSGQHAPSTAGQRAVPGPGCSLSPACRV